MGMRCWRISKALQCSNLCLRCSRIRASAASRFMATLVPSRQRCSRDSGQKFFYHGIELAAEGGHQPLLTGRSNSKFEVKFELRFLFCAECVEGNGQTGFVAVRSVLRQNMLTDS